MYRLLHTSRPARPWGRIVAVLFLLLALAATAVASPAARAQTQPPADVGQVDSIVQQLMTQYDVPGVAVGLIKDGQVVLTKGYGVRNTQTQQPVTENTVFAIGSISKSFTALDIAQLVDAGKLNLDAPVITYIPDFKLSDPAATRQVTLREFLSHTSGLPPFDDWYFHPETRQQLIDSLATVRLTAPPGKVWQYSNPNFVVAAYVLERVTGQSWEDYTRQHIFAPLGMQSANFAVTDTEKTADYASPHGLDVLKGVQPIPFHRDVQAIGPAGSINANVVDMTKYALFQLGNGTVDGTEATRLVSQSMLTTMHSPQIAIEQGATGGDQPGVQPSGQETQTTPTAGAPLPANFGYGLAWITEDYHGNKLVAHNGAIDGFYAYVTLVPGAKDGVVLLTNMEANIDGALFAEAARLQLVNWLLGVPSESNLVTTINQASGFDPGQFKANLQAARTYHADPAALAALTGDYPSVAGKITVTTRDGKLYLQVEGQPASAELVPFGPGDFLLNTYPATGQVISFKTDAQGTITVYQQGVQIAQRLGPGVQANEYKDPKGRFSVTVPQGLTVKPQGDLALITSTNPPGTFVVAAMDAGSNTLAANVKQFLQRLDPTFNADPVSTTEVPAINGVPWTQFVYTLPGGQVLAVLGTQQNGTTYLLLGQAKQADLAALTPTFQSLLINFKITAAPPVSTPTPIAVPSVTPVPGMPRTGTPSGLDLLGWLAGPLLVLAGLLLGAGMVLRRRAVGRVS